MYLSNGNKNQQKLTKKLTRGDAKNRLGNKGKLNPQVLPCTRMGGAKNREIIVSLKYVRKCLFFRPNRSVFYCEIIKKKQVEILL